MPEVQGSSRDRVFDMPTAVKWKKNWLIPLGIFLAFSLYYFFVHSGAMKSLKYQPFAKKTGYSVWPEFEPTPRLDSVSNLYIVLVLSFCVFV